MTGKAKTIGMILRSELCTSIVLTYNHQSDKDHVRRVASPLEERGVTLHDAT
jgi:hypothetical protein